MRRVLALSAALALALPASAQTPSTQAAEFSVAAVDFVTKNCPGLTIDYQKLEFVLKEASLTEAKAREGDHYKYLTTSLWPDAVMDIGMRSACYELQVHFVTEAKGNMHRLMFPQ